MALFGAKTVSGVVGKLGKPQGALEEAARARQVGANIRALIGA